MTLQEEINAKREAGLDRVSIKNCTFSGRNTLVDDSASSDGMGTRVVRPVDEQRVREIVREELASTDHAPPPTDAEVEAMERALFAISEGHGG